MTNFLKKNIKNGLKPFGKRIRDFFDETVYFRNKKRHKLYSSVDISLYFP